MEDSPSANKTWVSWFEIPVTHFDRAKSFYEKIFQIELTTNDLGELKMAIFPHGQIGGALVKSSWYTPGQEGPVLYLDANPDLANVLDKVTDAGGEIVVPKRQISPEHGFMALFLDTEGNRIALHSNT